MSDEPTSSIVINIPKPRFLYKHFKEPTEKEILVKPLKPKTQKTYLLPHITVVKPLKAVSFSKDDILLPYLSYSKKQENERFKERLKVSLSENYKIAYTDLHKRLHIDDPIDDVRGITDFDPKFFTCVKSTTLSEYVAPYKSLKHLFNSQIRLRQEVGYRRDCMINFDTNYKRELEIYDACVKRYQTQIKYLYAFISDDYKKSMFLLNKWEVLHREVNTKVYELQSLAVDKFTLTSKIVGLDYRYSLQQNYGRFLYYLSPPSWRLKNRNFARSIEIEARGFDFGYSGEEDTFNVIFEKLKKECIEGLIEPALYFEHHKDMINIFDGIEQQHLHYFIHVGRLAPHACLLKKGIKLYEDLISQDSAGIITDIREFETTVLFCEEQCLHLKSKFFKILNNLFYDSVGAPDVLKLQVHLDFCYAKVYNEPPMNLSIMGTARALEVFYMDYSRRLESITADTIVTAVKQYIESERLKFKKAKIAARELRQFGRLEKTLLRAFAPIEVKDPTIPIEVKRHVPKKLHVKTSSHKMQDNQVKLTDAELEYLTLFTNWTEKDDPASFLRSLSATEKNNTLVYE